MGGCVRACVPILAAWCSTLCWNVNVYNLSILSDMNQSARCCSRRSIITASTSNSYFATSFQGKRYVLYAFKVWRRLGMIGLTSRYSSSSEHPPASKESVKPHARISFPQCDVVMEFFIPEIRLIKFGVLSTAGRRGHLDSIRWEASSWKLFQNKTVGLDKNELM